MDRTMKSLDSKQLKLAAHLLREAADEFGWHRRGDYE